MFSLIKGIIWIIGTIVVALFVLNYFGYEANKDYFSQSKEKCQQRLESCAKQYLQEGINNAKCDFDCINPKLIIKKK